LQFACTLSPSRSFTGASSSLRPPKLESPPAFLKLRALRHGAVAQKHVSRTPTWNCSGHACEESSLFQLLPGEY
jgi:hypothetical protein